MAVNTTVDDLLDEDFAKFNKHDEDQEQEHGQFLRAGDPCPKCGGVLVLRKSDRGEFLGCANFPACTFVHRLRQGVLNILDLDKPCPWCGGELFVRRSRFGIFIGCENFPECTFSDIQESSNVVCPICKKGHLKRRQARNGKVFYGCDAYPNCKFTTQGEPVESPCPTCSFPLRYKKKVKAGIVLKCPNPLCPDRRKRKLELYKEE